ncbi:hypothetical protein ACTHOS_10055 [Bacillus safensis]
MDERNAVIVCISSSLWCKLIQGIHLIISFFNYKQAKQSGSPAA